MEFSNDILLDIERNRKRYNKKYGDWFYKMHVDLNDEIMPLNPLTGEILEIDNNRYLNKAERIRSCMNLWLWDAYHKNKILDLKKVNRCYNNRFCPNCRKIDISKFIFKFKDVLKEYVSIKGYSLYMLTLTIPNVEAANLNETLLKLSSAFHRLLLKYSPDAERNYKNRSIDMDGGVKVLEITYNQIENTYHPHYHCVVLVKEKISSGLLKKDILGKYSNKRKQYDYKSTLDCEIGLLWSMIWQHIRVDEKHIEKLNYIPSKMYLDTEERVRLLEVDFRPMNEKGFYEVFKYTFKNSEIINFDVFKTLELSLDKKRIRQGFGLLYNLVCEDVDIGEYQDLELAEDESPENLLTRQVSELYQKYKDYKKISRYNNIIDNNIND